MNCSIRDHIEMYWPLFKIYNKCFFLFSHLPATIFWPFAFLFLFPPDIKNLWIAGSFQHLHRLDRWRFHGQWWAKISQPGCSAKLCSNINSYSKNYGENNNNNQNDNKNNNNSNNNKDSHGGGHLFHNNGCPESSADTKSRRRLSCIVR